MTQDVVNLNCAYGLQLGVSYVDLYLIHSPRLAVPDIPTVWKQLEKIKADGLAKFVALLTFLILLLIIAAPSKEHWY